MRTLTSLTIVALAVPCAVAAQARGPTPMGRVLSRAPRVPSRGRWTGRRLRPDSVAVRLSGIRTILPLDSLDNRVKAAGQPLYTPLGHVRGQAADASQTTFNLTP